MEGGQCGPFGVPLRNLWAQTGEDLQSVRTTVSTSLHPTYRAGMLIK